MRRLSLDTCLFRESYADARAAFLAAAAARGLSCHSVPHPLCGPAGEALAMDSLSLGAAGASRVLVLLSATHGMEGYAGSALQTHLLTYPLDIPAGVEVLMVHAVNPHGFAWGRRVNEDNVDLNRNWVDFSAPLPDNPGYRALAEALLPLSQAPSDWQVADAALAAWRERHGERDYDTAVSGGQFCDPAGLFYGGREASWSRRQIEALVREHRLAERQAVAVVDVHTGLGPWGYGELICDHPPESGSAARVRRWFGAGVAEPVLGTSSSVPKLGLSDHGWQAMLGDVCGFVALEFGSYSTDRLFDVLRREACLHRQGDRHSPEAGHWLAAFREHFCPASRDWRELVLLRGQQVVWQALDALAEDAA